jgi:hypothetical protein
MMRAFRVLSLWEPHAILTVAIDPLQDPPRPAKGIESRHWNHPVRLGLPIDVVIHAAKKLDRENLPLLTQWPFVDCLERSGYYAGDPRPFTTRSMPLPRGLKPMPLGALVGVATITRVERSDVIQRRFDLLEGTEKMRAAEEMALGNYTPNRFGLHLENAVAFPEPIPYSGRQDVLYYLDPQMSDLVHEQLARVTALEAA